MIKDTFLISFSFEHILILGDTMKNKCIVTISFILCLFMLLFPWFHYHDYDVRGLIMLEDPIALTCLVLIIVGIWSNYGMNSIILGHIGFIGLLVMEIYEFMSWHVLTITGHYSLVWSMQATYPTFYIALLVTMITYMMYRRYLTK